MVSRKETEHLWKWVEAFKDSKKIAFKTPLQIAIEAKLGQVTWKQFIKNMTCEVNKRRALEDQNPENN